MPQTSPTYHLRITGLVQGVGFRPFIYRLAHEHGLCGKVWNTNECVHVVAQGEEAVLERFVKEISRKAPPAAMIDSVILRKKAAPPMKGFIIGGSTDHSTDITQVSPDIAVCPDCLEDMREQPYRLGYPFVNCTCCGPRFTIIETLPYDRPGTTMKDFVMCDSCAAEYGDVLDRRFHAQPIACNRCGPAYQMQVGGRNVGGDLPRRAATLLDNGKVLAIKGLGGYHLACNALDAEAVDRLRGSKRREAKPFAVMFRDLESAKRHCHVSDTEAAWLQSWRRPIVILETHNPLAPGVSNGLHTTGVLLPYMPFHYLLFEQLHTYVIILTSGNLSDEPIVIDDRQAAEVLGPVADAVLSYNRRIHNRADDPVLLVVNEKPRLIRRSRGFVPHPVSLAMSAEGIFAAGAELVNCFAMGKGREALMSQHIGDLKNLETLEFYEETYERFCRLFRFTPSLAACDKHPDYLSTRFAQDLGLPMIEVQHHHAHIASVLAEHGIRHRVLGISFDGTGYGDDDHIWGGDFMHCDLAGYERLLHFRYVQVPGGDRVSVEPWRMGLSYLTDAFGHDLPDLEFLYRIEEKKRQGVLEAMEKDLNCPLSSSAGRLFDAVAAITGICSYAGFHAEAPMRLENAIQHGLTDHYPYEINHEIDFRPAIMAITEDLYRGTAPGVISARFHNTLLASICEATKKLMKQTGLRDVAFSGGSFQNRYLLEKLELWLEEEGIPYYTNQLVPCNDGGIALGQMAVAAVRRDKGYGI